MILLLCTLLLVTPPFAVVARLGVETTTHSIQNGDDDDVKDTSLLCRQYNATDTCGTSSQKKCTWIHGACVPAKASQHQATQQRLLNNVFDSCNSCVIDQGVCVTDTTAKPTLVPTAKPTSSPTKTPPTPPGSPSATFTCPAADNGSSSALVMTFSPGTLITLNKSVQDTVCTISVVSPDATWFQPVARSYNYGNWESYGGVHNNDHTFRSLEYACSANACTVTLPDLPSSEYVFQLTTFAYTAPSSDAVTARFLEQATFGTRMSDIASFPSTPEEWIQQQQQNVPMTSHRAYFRSRVNYRSATPQMYGTITKPCNLHSRYRVYAFTSKDENFDKLEFKNANGKIYLLFQGQARTVVGSIKGTVNGVDKNFPTSDGMYKLCVDPQDGLGSSFHLQHPAGPCCEMHFDGVYGNPRVWFDADTHPPTNELLDLDGHAEFVDTELYSDPDQQELILTSPLTDQTCNDIPDRRTELMARTERAVVGGYSGEYFLFDARPVLQGNSLDDPLQDGGGSVVAETRIRDNLVYKIYQNMQFQAGCANAPRTFLNEDSCVLSYHPNVCTPQEEPGTRFDIEAWALARILQATGGHRDPRIEDGPGTRYVLYIDNLRNGDGTDPPCTPGARSRWRIMPDMSHCDGSLSEISSSTQQLFANLLSITIDPNKYIRDVNFPSSGDACHSSDVNKFDFTVPVGNTCYQNVHPDTLQVYDFTDWARGGPNGDALHPGGAEHIKKWSKWNYGGYMEFLFPASHPMSNYYEARDSGGIVSVGRLGDVINWYDLPPGLAENEAIAARFDTSPPAPTDGAAIVCGSPNEVANNPLSPGGLRAQGFGLLTDRNRTEGIVLVQQRQTVWTEVALNAPDQLRQRVAWALSQILAISPGSIDTGFSTEVFMNYYDIFVRHAFGNYRDILKEVAYSPMMAEMLSYIKSQSTSYIWDQDSTIEYPDENFAREIMQLFSIGLHLLNDAGTPEVDSYGTPLPSYTNRHVTEYARLWTGFDYQKRRGNLEEDDFDKNLIDPMQIRISWRDHLPKMGLNHQYVGHDMPLCSALGPRHFLKSGAKFILLGSRPLPELIQDPPNWDASYRPALPESSLLYERLCNRSGGSCQFHTKYELTEDLACKGFECHTDSLRVFSVAGMFYEYVRPPCTQIAFFPDPKVIATTTASETTYEMCGDPAMEIASTMCCDTGSNSASDFAAYPGERRKFDKAELICAQNGKEICSSPSSSTCADDICDESLYYWTSRSCQQKVKINFEGDVAIVHAPGGQTSVSRTVSEDTKVFFRVDWDTGTNPFESNYQSTCSDLDCDYDDFESYCLCNANVSGSDVVVGNGGHRFRNPVHFIALPDPEVRDAHYETDAALDQYFKHPNMAPFLATRLAQRFGISNPSPRYVKRIADAFRTGSYTSDGITFGTSTYGDLGSTIAAVLLDREARSVVLDADPVQGSLFEPFLKITRLMRSLEFASFPDFPYIRFKNDLQGLIGQEPHQLPSVFSFFRPEYKPEGPVGLADLVSPESQVTTGPNLISFLNGMFSYLRYGLESDYRGFGYSRGGQYNHEPGDYGHSSGANTFSSNEVIDDLALLLTSGRLSSENRDVIQSAYDFTLSGTKTGDAMINTMLLLATTPEFHSSGLVRRTGSQRPAPPAPQPPTKPYKAIVYVMLSGGMDSYSMLVPHTCSGAPSLRTQYEEERGKLAFTSSERSVTITANNQPCTKFALHDELKELRDLYEGNDLLFMANTGVINNHAMTKTNYRGLTATQLFSHNFMQDEIQKIDPFHDAPGTGVLGRAADALSDNFSVQKITINAPSIALVGNPGDSTPPVTVSQRGAEEFNQRAYHENNFDLEAYARDLNGETELMSNVFGQTFSQEYIDGVEASQYFTAAFDSATLSSAWDGKPQDELWQKFNTISKLIKKRQDRGSERDMFFVEFGSWDHHSDLKTNIRDKFEPLNRNLKAFVSELKSQGVWDDVTIVFASEFARTITGNSGRGSDHAWGGHYWMTGGSVKGGQIIGEYPSDITPDGPLNIGRGRIIPTTSWDSIWNGIVEWFGVPPKQMDAVLPNRDNAVDQDYPLYTSADLFK